MTFDEAMQIAKANPGHGVREKSMNRGWKITYIRWPKKGKHKAGGDFFCINPISGSNYLYTPKPTDKVSKHWGHA